MPANGLIHDLNAYRPGETSGETVLERGSLRVERDAKASALRDECTLSPGNVLKPCA